ITLYLKQLRTLYFYGVNCMQMHTYIHTFEFLRDNHIRSREVAKIKSIYVYYTVYSLQTEYLTAFNISDQRSEYCCCSTTINLFSDVIEVFANARDLGTAFTAVCNSLRRSLFWSTHQVS